MRRPRSSRFVMADETSDEPCVKKEADFKRTLPNHSKEITNITNGKRLN